MSDDRKNNYVMIDILKLFFCLCIVALHSRATIEWSMTYYIQNAVFRVAVPFFFCASGFFVGKKIQSGMSIKNIINNFIIRVLPAYCLFLFINTIFYIRDLIVIKHENIQVIIVNVIKSLIFYPQGALWYVWASIIALIILWKFIENDRLKTAILLGIVLYSFALVCNTYYFVIENTIFQNIIDNYMSLFISARNGVFVGLIFMGMGIKCAYANVKKISLLNIALIISYLLFIFEIFQVRNKRYIDDKALYITLIILIPVLVLWASKINISLKVNNKKLREMSVGIYFLHRAILYCVNAINVHYSLDISFFHTFIIVTTIAIIVCRVSYKVPCKYINTLLR